MGPFITVYERAAGLISPPGHTSLPADLAHSMYDNISTRTNRIYAVQHKKIGRYVAGWVEIGFNLGRSSEN